METIEISSWLTLDAIKETATIVETFGDLQTGNWQSIFCFIEDDYFELGYLDTESNYLKRFEDKEEFEQTLEKKMEDGDETPYGDEETYEEEEEEFVENDPVEIDVPEDEENFT